MNQSFIVIIDITKIDNTNVQNIKIRMIGMDNNKKENLKKSKIGSDLGLT